MPFWKRKNKLSRIKIEDRNIKRQEGLDKLFEIFKEVTGDHEKYIDKFIQEHQAPDQEIMDFILKYKLELVENEAPLTRFKRAQAFVKMRNKYGLVFTAFSFQKLCDLMRNDYSIDLRFESITNLNLNTEAIKILMKAASKISLEDTNLYGLFRSNSYYSYSRESREVKNKKLLQLIQGKKPEGLEYGQPFELSWNEKEEELLKKELREEQSNWLPRQFSYGEFQAIQVETDPIFIANLKDQMYMTVGYIHTLPQIDHLEV